MCVCVCNNERVSMQILIKGDNGEVFTEPVGSFPELEHIFRKYKYENFLLQADSHCVCTTKQIPNPSAPA